MQDTTVGAWAVMLHEECMGWVPTNISYVYAWYVHAYLGMYMSYTCMYRFTKSCPGGKDSRCMIS